MPCFSTVEKASLNKLRRNHWTRNGEEICLTPAVFFRGNYELRPAVKKLYQLRPKVSDSRVSVASRVVNPKHDELRPAVSKELYQLRPKVSDSRVSVASRVVNPKHDELHPVVSKKLYQLRPKVSASCVFVVYRVVNRTRVSCIERCVYTNCPTI
jgi:hypothetical protein